VDAPIDPRLESFEDVSVFACDSPTLKRDLQGWLRTQGTPAGQPGRSA
jgi:hypothetical protein